MRGFSIFSLLPLLLAAAPASATTAAAADATTSLAFQIGLPAHQQDQPDGPALRQQLLAALPAWTRATLEAGDGRQLASAPLTAGGRLVFANVTAGSYLGEVHCATHAFAPLRVDVVPVEAAASAATEPSLLRVAVAETYRGNSWGNRGEALRRLPAADGTTSSSGGDASGPTFLVAPLSLQTKAYYTERGSFSPLSLLRNPMILMGVVAMGIMFGMPYLMENMDPEMRAEFEERQKANPMNSLLGGGGGGAAAGGGFDVAGFLAGTGSSSSNSRSGGGGNSGSGSGNKNQGGGVRR